MGEWERGEPVTLESRPANTAPLPVVYESPWRLLGRDLTALTASLRLLARELLRRNNSGDLPRPGPWPRDLAPLFWPLVLAVTLTLSGLLVWTLQRRPAASPTPAAQGVIDSTPLASGAESPGTQAQLPPSERNTNSQQGSATLEQDSGTIKTAKGTATASGMDQALPQSEDITGSADPQPTDTSTRDTPTTASQADSGYIADGDGLIEGPATWLELIEQPKLGSVILRLDAPYSLLRPEQRQQLAERWWERAQSQGFERLELRDIHGRLLGHSARLGSGMILLDPGLLPPWRSA
ncbi:hypothetical protein VB716_06485 [Synechococcus sp. CCY9201]|uniref:hypothetical protein n=1 Tax=Synechococcus sp. CCY9201 TaxID=174697 RepID=UPI002B21EA7D|nr:hypothetical protein [Synechococcus sp. CCY9201]MEA5473866.1 hypothetical protein [Synechococcus sp. CCY9201]